MIVVIDYELGNVGSVLNMLRRLGYDTVLSADPGVILKADKLILPGVGSFDQGMLNLEKKGLIECLNQRVKVDKIPFLGICLGAQLLLNSSDEGNLPGLGWIKGKAKKFEFEKIAPSLRVPHMGWNVINPVKDHYLLHSLANDARFYFVHKYFIECEVDSDILASSTYGHKFASAVARDNIVGFQFHPEKSLRWGMKVLGDFAGGL